MRVLAAWERNGKWYLSAFVGPRVHADRSTPAKEFSSRAELERHAATMIDGKRRKPEIVWEYEGPGDA